VLTGAGFSKDAGLPLTSELVQRGRDLLNTRLALEFVSALDKVAHEVLGEKIGVKIEAVLTRMKVLELYSETYNPDEPGSVGEHYMDITTHGRGTPSGALPRRDHSDVSPAKNPSTDSPLSGREIQHRCNETTLTKYINEWPAAEPRPLPSPPLNIPRCVKSPVTRRAFPASKTSLMSLR
jgi:hypothetical protein